MSFSLFYRLNGQQFQLFVYIFVLLMEKNLVSFRKKIQKTLLLCDFNIGISRLN